MARLPRLFAPDQPQHVIQRGNNCQAIFHDEADYHRFLEFLGGAIREHSVALHAYVLMSDHIHLLATPSGPTSLARVMQSVGRRYVRYFNDRTTRSGTLWEGRYKSTLIDSERYLMVCSRYIELNPVRAGIVEVPQAYPWSSFAHHAGLTANPLITDHAQYWSLGNTPFERQAAYRLLFEQELSAEQLTRIRDSTNKGWALGSEGFTGALLGKANRRVTPLPKGRPRGSKSRSSTDKDDSVPV